jgi:molybdate transport system ATP-binding protein
LLKRLRVPTVVVTHDWNEALALGDLMAVIEQGRVLQVGAPQEVFSRPRNAEVARVVGVETVAQGTVRKIADGLATVEVGTARLTALSEAQPWKDVFVCIRAEDVVLESFGAGATSARNRLAGTIVEMESAGALVKVAVDCGFLLQALVTRSAAQDLRLSVGGSVAAVLKAGAVHLVPRTDGASAPTAS